MRQERKVILLAGPTASGKSKLAIKLAEHYNAEIINASCITSSVSNGADRLALSSIIFVNRS